MKNLHVKAMAALIAVTLIGGTAITATKSLATDSFNEDVNMVVASSGNYSDSDRYSKDSSHESDERGGSDDDGRRYDDSRTGTVTLEEAIKIATSDTQGEVLEVEFERGRYEVKLRTKDGYKKEIYVSAKDGRIVRRK
ncbi:hypothetical protein MNBD_DELTA01-2014 [hydrothermal vent metagenome]|uniref:PepSY domain-containing protein n=1 Tax=hydrothermal vent metagenome TaxID=652676 RepID=A0A3B0RCD7_9ZZZZ